MEQVQTEKSHEEGIHLQGTHPRPLPPRPFVEKEDDHRTYSPPRRTASPESLDPRSSRRRSGYRNTLYVDTDDELRYGERDRSYYGDRSRSPPYQRSRERIVDPLTQERLDRERREDYYDTLRSRARERNREPEVEHEYPRRTSPSLSVTSEDSYDTRESYETEGRYEPPEYRGKSLKFDVNLSSLATDNKDNQTTKAHRPTKTPSMDEPEIVSIETSRRYTDSVGETLVLTTGVKVSSSQLGHLHWM